MEKKPLLPTIWPVVPLGRIFEKQDVAPKPGDGVVTAFRDGNVMLRSRRRLDGFTESLKEIGYQRVTEGDLVIHSMDAFAGAIGVAQDTGKSTPVYIVLKPKENIYPKYYSYVLRAYAQAGAIQSLTQGIRERSTDFRWSVAKSLLVPLPPYKDQKRIADELDRELAEIDEFIADITKLQKLIEEREIAELEKNLVENATAFVELRRFKPRCISGTSVNAAPWQAGDSELGVLKTGVVSKGYFDPSQNKAVIEESEITRLSVPVKAKTIIVNRANSPELVGSAAFVDKDYPNLFLSDKLWQVDFEDANNEYMAAVMQTRFFKEQVRQRCVGASSSMQNLSYQDFLSIKVPESKYQKIKKTYKQYNELKLLIIDLEEKKISTIAEKMKGDNSESR